jgi:hypothetical protein
VIPESLPDVNLIGTGLVDCLLGAPLRVLLLPNVENRFSDLWKIECLAGNGHEPMISA